MDFTFTRPETGEQITLADNGSARYRVPDPSDWLGSWDLRGSGGVDLAGRHGRSVRQPRVPAVNVKSLPVTVFGDSTDELRGDLEDLMRVIGPKTHDDGTLDLEVDVDGHVRSGRVMVVDPQVQLDGPHLLRVTLDVELVDGALFGAEETYTFDLTDDRDETKTVTNNGTVEDVWSQITIAAEDPDDPIGWISCRNLDWINRRPPNNAVGFTVYAEFADAEDDDEEDDQDPDPDVDLDGMTIDSGRLTVTDKDGDPQTGVLRRRGWHPHWLPLHPGDNEVRVARALIGTGSGEATVTLKRKDPFA